MIESLMLCGIGFLAGCLLTLLIVPFVHRRAVRFAKRSVLAASPMTMPEVHLENDLLRARFAMEVRRLELQIEDVRKRSALQLGVIGEKSTENHRLRCALQQKDVQILALQAQQLLKNSITKRVIKLLTYFSMQSDRRRRRAAIQPKLHEVLARFELQTEL
jgi:hypothetical protein